jgi:hypothetical protein
MKILTNYVKQTRPYADSYGHCVIEIEDGDKVDEIIEKYVKTPRKWYEQSYSHPICMKEFRDFFGKKHEGNLLVFTTKRIYLD